MIDYGKIPESTLETLQAWIEHARPMGGFCQAVVSNDLMNAFSRADECNRVAMFEIICWLYNYAPIGSWGSLEALKGWPKHIAAQKAERKAGA